MTPKYTDLCLKSGQNNPLICATTKGWSNPGGRRKKLRITQLEDTGSCSNKIKVKSSLDRGSSLSTFERYKVAPKWEWETVAPK